MCEIIILEPRRPRRCLHSPPLVCCPSQKVVASVPGTVEDKEILAAAPPKNEISDKKTSRQPTQSTQSTQPPKPPKPPKPTNSNTSKSDQQPPSPETIRRVKVKPAPTTSRLPKKVRFAMDSTSSTESLSSSSGRSDASYIDSPAAVTPMNGYPSHDESSPLKPSSRGSERPAQHLPESLADPDSDSDSELGSAIDCGEDEFQRPITAPPDVQSPRPHVYGKLGSSFQWPRRDSDTKGKTIAFSFPSSSGKLDQPIFVYRRKGRRDTLSKKDPIFILRQSSADKKLGSHGKGTAPGFVKIDDAKKPGGLRDATGEHKSKKQSVKRKSKKSSHKPPMVTDEADEGLHYDPALRILWRDA